LVILNIKNPNSNTSEPTEVAVQAYGCTEISPDENPFTEPLSNQTGAGLTASQCAEFCLSNGFNYTLNSYDNCYCGSGLKPGLANVNGSLCDNRCTNDQTQICGGGAAYNPFLPFPGPGKAYVDIFALFRPAEIGVIVSPPVLCR
jgi:hypothetical protein